MALGFNGAMGFQGYGICSGRIVTCGVSFRRKADGTVDIMGGLNSPIFIAGHLGDRGLAAEARNPEASAMGRIGEKTGYRADLRSSSDSRFGVCTKLPEGRLGAVWERRGDENFCILWAIPVFHRAWTWELLYEAGFLKPSEREDSWYPSDIGRSGGFFSSAASRIAFRPKKWDFSVTLLVSGSPYLRPGLATAVSIRHSVGPWRLRTRCVYATEYFRNAEGEKAHGPVGAAIDLKFAPLHGFRFDIDYEFRLDSNFLASPIPEDEGAVSFGWRFGNSKITASADWNALAVRGPEDAGVLNLKKVELEWESHGDIISFEVGTSYWPDGIWEAGFNATYHPSRFCKIAAAVDLEGGEGVLNMDIALDWKLKRKSHTLMVSMDFRDLMTDWEGGPENVEDLEASLRWIFDFR